MRTLNPCTKVTCSNGRNAPGADRRCWRITCQSHREICSYPSTADYFLLHDKCSTPDFWNPAESFFQSHFQILERNVTRRCADLVATTYQRICRVHFIILGMCIRFHSGIFHKKIYQCKTSKQTGITVLVFSKGHGSSNVSEHHRIL